MHARTDIKDFLKNLNEIARNENYSISDQKNALNRIKADYTMQLEILVILKS